MGEASGLMVGDILTGVFTSGGRMEVEVEADGMAATLGLLAGEAMPWC